MQLDTATLNLVGLLTALMLPLLMWVLGRNNAEEPGVRDWQHGSVAYGAGFLCLALRGVAPDLISIVLGNTLLVFGYARFTMGLRRFFGMSCAYLWDWALAVFVALMMAYWSLVVPDIDLRIALVSWLVAALFVVLAMTAMHAVVPASELPTTLRYVFVAVMAISALLVALRGSVHLFKDMLQLQPGVLSLIFNSSYLLAIISNVLFGAFTPLLVSLRRQSALATNHARLERAHRVGQLMIFDLDVVSGRGVLNDVARDRLGPAAPEHVSLEYWLSRVHPEDRPIVQQRVERVHERTQSLAPVEYRLQLPGDNSEIWVRGNTQVDVDHAGRPLHISAIVSDITEQKLAVLATARAADAAESANRAKSEFLANMSHELRTPLNGVIGMAQLLQQSPLNSAQREYADTLIDSAQSLLGIINDVLDYSKIEAGRLSMEAVDFALAPLLRNLQIAHSATAASRSIECRLEMSPELPVTVRGDPLRLRQILGNLLSNAIKFTPAGSVTLTVSRCADTPDTLRFEVRDSGIGMDTATLKQLFQPFHQADASVTRRFGGTGLGLSIVHRLVSLLGGSIRVHSTLGQGSVFVVELPMICPADKGSGVSDEAAAVTASVMLPRSEHRMHVVDSIPANHHETPSGLTSASAQLAAAEIQPQPPTSSFDEVRLLRQAMDDPALAHDVATSAAIDLRTLALELDAAARAAHWPDAQRISHTLKGLALQVAATDATECFRALENACKNCNSGKPPPPLMSFTHAGAMAGELAAALDGWRP